MPSARVFEGHLFDVYNLEHEMHLWVLDSTGRARLFKDVYYPTIYAHGPSDLLKKLVARLEELDALYRPPRFVHRKHFYRNTRLEVLELVLSRPSVLNKIRRRLYALYGRLDIFHSDIEIPTAYLYSRGIYPLARVRFYCQHERIFNRITRIELLSERHQSEAGLEARVFDYELPRLRILSMALRGSHRLGLSERNPLLIEVEDRRYELSPVPPLNFLKELNRILAIEDPDVVLSAFGDQTIMPAVFSLSQKHNVPLGFDRDLSPRTLRNIVRRGTSYNTYGSWIYVAPSYPFFGRWHIDSANSFVYKEADLAGIVELARLSRIPVQKLARSSTGTALTSIETDVALNMGYLVPWQKSAIEAPKTAYELLIADKGGLVFLPETRDSNVFEQVAQIDFGQMYPSIMVQHNISPECVNCECCASDPDAPRVPETGYHVCRRRRGVVSEALRHVLERRRFYKQRKLETTGAEREIYDARQNSIKWMLVTSFGYLGYRNAKFGRIESHESVTAIGRKVLLQAKDISEAAGYHVCHAITDCLFLRRTVEKHIDKEHLLNLCERIGRETGIEMKIEGIYDWVIFPRSRVDPEIGVVNRYAGRFTDGSIKYRGIAARRKDTPPFIHQAQMALLELMSTATTIAELQALHSRVHGLFQQFDQKIQSARIPWRELLLRRKISRELDQYRVRNAAYSGLRQLAERGMEVQPGERLRFLVRNHKHPAREKRVIAEELAEFGPEVIGYDRPLYRRLLREAFEELWQYFAPENYFRNLGDPQPRLFD